MDVLRIKPQTVIMTVAPTCAGKTYFVENVLIPSLRTICDDYLTKRVNIQHLSSDNFRREMLGYNPYLDEESDLPLKNEFDMEYVSEQAFAMLKTKLEAVMSFPVNADFVIVDTTGMSKEFRDEVVQAANKANYSLQVLLFEYKNREDYFKFADNEGSFDKKRINDSVKRFKDKLSEITKKEYGDLFKIKSNDFSNIQIEVDGLHEYGKHFIGQTFDYLIVGDVHGCYDELKELLGKNGFVFDEADNLITIPKSQAEKPLKVLFVGDIVDKGEQISECIEFVHKLVTRGYALLTRGNHENFVYNYLKGSPSYLQTPRDFIETFLSTVGILEKNEELKLKFFELFERGSEFYTNGKFIVTHAPCKNEYLGKIRPVSLKMQRNFKVSKLDENATAEEIVKSKETDLAFLKEEARYNHPFHIVGHIMLSNVVQFNNKVMIDTGCVAGGRLTSVICTNGKLYFNTVKSTRENKFSDDVFALFAAKKNIDLDELDPKERTRIKYMCLEKVNFISGTMSPADKDVENNVLESLNQAIQYYKNAGVKKIILQPKHMGSRGNVYLFNDPEKCYVTTRNGYRMRDNVAPKEEVIAEYKRLINKFFSPATLLAKVQDREIISPKLIILDAEILPWRAVGKGLIDHQFTPVSIAVESESNILIEHGFEEVLEDYSLSDDYRNYVTDRAILKKDELTTKYGYAKERSFRSFYDYKHMQLEEELSQAKRYDSQVKLFGGEAPFRIEPFSLLKVVFETGTEKTYENESNIDIYKMVSDKFYAVLDFEENEYARKTQPDLFVGDNKNEYIVRVYDGNGNEGRNTAAGFFYYVTNGLLMEGIVAKPEIVYTKGVAPYIKVRNENYLTIVYGHNYKFKNKYEKLLMKKSVSRKLKASIKEFEIGMQMLKTPYDTITVENEPYKQLLAQMIIEVEKEKELDPRL